MARKNDPVGRDITAEAVAGALRPVRRVTLVGAESTGKTTLAAALAVHFKTVWTPEYLRTFVDEKGAVPVFSDTEALVQGHLAQEDTLEPLANRVLFLDTDLIATCVYSRYYFGVCPAWVERLSYERSADLYLLTDTDIPWAPDPGQRDGPAVRAELQARFQQELETRAVPYVLVSGSLDRRMEVAVRTVAALLAGRDG